MKKGIKRLLSFILTVCFLLSIVAPIASLAAPSKKLSKDDLLTTGNVSLKTISGGVRVTHPRESEGWARAFTNESYLTEEEGAQVEIKDIACLDPDYSFTVMFGNDKGAWYNGTGYLLVYGKGGNFSIVASSSQIQDANTSPILVSEKREALGKDLSINVRLVENKYVITVNEKEYSVPASHVSSPESIYFTFAMASDGESGKQNWNRTYENSAFSYTIAQIKDGYEPEGIEPIGKMVTGKSVGLTLVSDVQLWEGDAGIQLGFTEKTAGWGRATMNSTFSLVDDSVKIKLTQIQSQDDNYSVAVMLGNQNGYWYNGMGYFIVYGKSGNFTIMATYGEDLGKHVEDAKIFVSEMREPLEGDLDIEVNSKDNQYEFVVNGKSYMISDTGFLKNPKEIYAVFGVPTDGKFNAGMGWDKSYKKGPVSFVIAKETYVPEDISTRTLKTFAEYEAFMTGYEDGTFKPDEKLSRGEAIVAVSKLLVDAKDIQGVYESEFTDLKKKDSNYSIYAYMEKNRFMPDFGDELKPDQAITRGEFAILVQGDRKATVSEADKPITRGEAAKIICEYLGKTTSEEKVTFSDISGHEFEKYILLAANKQEIKNVKLEAKDSTELQNCVNQAIALSTQSDAKVTIELQDGTYHVAQPIEIQGSQYGQYDVAIEFKNAKDASPVITGTLDVQGSEFQKVSGKDYYSYQLSEETKVDGAWPEFRDLYVNGERLELARSEDYVFTMNRKADGSNCLYVDSGAFEAVEGENASPMELCIDMMWLHKYFRVATAVKSSTHSGLHEIALVEEDFATFPKEAEVTTQNIKALEGLTYWMNNHLALLDEPGEFFYDDQTGTIYVYPYKDVDMKKATVGYSVVERLFNLESVSDVSFEGITFTGTTFTFTNEFGFNSYQGGYHQWNDVNKQRAIDTFLGGDSSKFDDWYYEITKVGAITGSDTDFVTVKNCTFDALGTAGIYLIRGNRGLVVSGSSFTDNAMSAIYMGQPNLQWNMNDGQTNVIINNNYIDDVSYTYHTFPGILLFKCKNVAVTHNTITKTPYSGLHLGWFGEPSKQTSIRGAEVAYNYLENNLYAGDDGGALYVCGANSLPQDKEMHNFFYKNYVRSNGYLGANIGIYLDNNSSNYKVYDNVLTAYDSKAYGPIFNQDHVENAETYNNILQNNYTTMRMISTLAGPERNIQLIDNEMFATFAELPKAATKIMETAGQQKKYAAAVPTEKMQVEVSVPETHAEIPINAKTPDDCVVFKITNNGTKDNTYRLLNTNSERISKDITMTISDESISLKPGESGTISVSFSSGDALTQGDLFDFAVKDENGRREEFDKLMSVKVVREAVNSSAEDAPEILLPAIIGGIVVLLAAGVIVVVVIKKKQKEGENS